MQSPLAQAIRDARRSAQLTQEQLGRYMGLKGRAVYRWECGHAVPRRRMRWLLLRQIQLHNPEAAAKLSAAFEAHTARVKGLVPAPPPPALPAPAKPSGAVALELALLAAADELDLSPRRLRASLARLCARAGEAGYSLDAMRHEMDARSAGSPAVVDV